MVPSTVLDRLSFLPSNSIIRDRCEENRSTQHSTTGQLLHGNDALLTVAFDQEPKLALDVPGVCVLKILGHKFDDVVQAISDDLHGNIPFVDV